MDSNEIKKSEMSAFDDTEAFLHGAEESPYWNEYHQRIKKRLTAQFKDGQTLLEVGCGKSVYLPLVKKKSAMSVGLDINKNLLKLNKGCECVLADSEHLPFASGCFDFVLCVGALHHLPEKAKGIREITRVCKKQLLIIEPHSICLILW